MQLKHNSGGKFRRKFTNSHPATIWRGLEELEIRRLLIATAAPDFYVATQHEPLIADGLAGNPAKVLANDIDAVQAVLATAPSHGAISLLADGSFTYTPDPNFYGTDTFTYSAGGASVNTQLMAANSTWSWLHPTTGVDPALQDPDFNTTWYTSSMPGNAYNGPGFLGSGPAMLGYGSINYGPIATNINLPPSGMRYTAYFRSTFNISDKSRVTDLSASILADDGAFIYINGRLVGSRNMGNAADIYTAFSVDANNTEEQTYAVDLSEALPFLSNGQNYIAVSVHNQSATSSDLGFQLTLTAAVIPTAPSQPATVTIEVVDGHHSPVVVDDVYGIAEDTTLNTAVGLLPSAYLNDRLLPGDSIEQFIVDATATRGSVSFDGMTGHFIYIPEMNFHGVDSFTYTLIDKDGASNPAVVSINVLPVEDIPVAVDDAYELDANDSLIRGAVGTERLGTGHLWKYSDTNYDWAARNADGTIPHHWSDPLFNPMQPGAGQSSWASGASPLGYGDVGSQASIISYGPLVGAKYPTYYFLNEFTLSVEEAAELSEAIIDIRRDDGAAVYINGRRAFTHGLPDVFGHATYATTSVDGSAETTYYRERLTRDYFVPGRNVVAVEIHQFDAGNSDVSFDLRLVTLGEDHGVMANDIDPDDFLQAALVAKPANGTLTFHSDGGFSYIPYGNFSGLDSFTYRVNDGKANSNLATVTIRVNPVDGPPVAIDDAYNLREDEILIIDAAHGLLSNESGSSINLSAELHGEPLYGTLQMTQDGSFVYSPNPNFYGEDSFTYTVRNPQTNLVSGIATVRLSIASSPDPADAIDDYYVGAAGVTLSSTVTPQRTLLENDLQPPDQTITLRAQLVAGPSHGTVILAPGGTFSYTPSPGFHGVDSFTYRATALPVQMQLLAETSPWRWLHPLNGTNPALLDPDFNATWQTSLMPESAYDGPQFSGPAAGLFGYGAIDYAPIVTDIGTPPSNLRHAAYFIAEFHVDDPTLVTSLTSRILADDGALIHINGQLVASLNMPAVTSGNHSLSALDADATEDRLYDVNLSSGISSLTPGRNYIAVSIHNNTPTSSDLGFLMSLQAVVAPAPPSEPATVEIHVLLNNQQPIAMADDYIINRGQSFQVNTLINDSDPNGDPLIARLVTSPANGSLSLAQDGMFTYSPTPGFIGLDSFTYVVNDGQVDSRPATVTIHSTLPGDFDFDFDVETDDIDFLSAQIRNAAPYQLKNDLNQDGAVDHAGDVIQEIVQNILGTAAGDANLDGRVSLADLVLLAEHYTHDGGWAHGDFNGDGKVTLADLISLGGNYGGGLPFIEARLAHDTAPGGATNNDRITANPSIAGRLHRTRYPSPVQSLRAGLDDQPLESYVDISSLITHNSIEDEFEFTLSSELINLLAGGTLMDGDHVLRIMGADDQGPVNLAPLAFKYDATAPTVELLTPDRLDEPVSHIDILFSEGMAPSAADPTNYDLRLMSSTDSWLSLPILSVEPIAGQYGAYRLILASPLPFRDYELVVSPVVEDIVGNSMASQAEIRFSIVPDSPIFPGGRMLAASGAETIVSADFNGDSVPDLAVANEQSNDISLFLGRGDGTFHTHSLHPAGDGPLTMATGDFNGDGLTDLSVINRFDGDVSVYLSNGIGGFEPQRRFQAALRPSSITTADFNHDGALDLAVACYDSDDRLLPGLSILLGIGDGTFHPEQRVPTSIGVSSVTAGDFNEDGDLDLIVGIYNFSDMQVFIGNGLGQFQAGQRFTSGFTYSMITGDLDGNGHLDVAAVNRTSSGISVLMGLGNGTFQPRVSYTTDFQPHTIALGDIDKDGKPDLAVSSGSGDNVWIFINNGTGVFLPQPPVPSGNSSAGLALNDLNSDGLLDMAIVASHGVGILLAQAPGSFFAQSQYSGFISPTGIVSADFDRDGASDIVVVDRSSEDAYLLLGNGDGSFQPFTRINVVNGSASVATGDFNGDGMVDLAIGHYHADAIGVLLGNGDGTFKPVRHYPVGDPDFVTTGDVDGDGIVDILLVDPSRSELAVLLGIGDGTFMPEQRIKTGQSPMSAAIADFNNDGLPDIATALSTTDVVAILLSDGSSTLRTQITLTAGDEPTVVRAADFNQDGRMDLAVANRTSRDVSIYLGRGDGSFLAERRHLTNAISSDMAILDVNGDGTLDLVTSSSSGVEISLGLGDGEFGQVRRHFADSNTTYLSIADFNNDGRPDLAVAGRLNERISVLLNILPPAPPPMPFLAERDKGEDSEIEQAHIVDILSELVGL